MSHSNFQLPESFDGHVRLFPLPNLVLFPGVMQALNLFEPRYRQLMEDVLEDDHLITMALVKPDPVNLSMPVPEICQTVCVGKIMTHAKLENGTYNLFLAGVSRAVIVDELSSDTPYRQAKVKLVSDSELSESEEQLLRAKLLLLLKQTRGSKSHFNNQTEIERFEVGQLVDIIAYSSGISPMEQQRILETTDIRARSKFLISALVRLSKQDSDDGGGSREFPPGFSLN